jgi:uncharacterized surface protein with fasciclin (FAS1) repeats
VTILAPSDGTFSRTLSEETMDRLLLRRHDRLRALLEAHMVEGVLSLSDLLEAGEVTTMSGETVTVEPAGDGVVRFGDAETLCADYRATNARIHLIDEVLGELPRPAPTQEPPMG